MILTLLLLFSFWCYASASGYKDGILYSLRGADAFTWNEHNLYTVERVFIGLIFFITYFCGKYFTFESNRHLGLWLFMMGLGVFMSFSFWHNGFYNLARKNIDIPRLRFMSNTGRYGVTMHFSPKDRIVGLILGLFFIVMTTINTVG